MDTPWTFIAKKIIEAVLFSPVLPFLLIAYGLLKVRRHPAKGLFFSWCGLLLLVFCSTLITVNWMAKGLENFSPITMDQLKSVQAVVILGGGERGYAREYNGPICDRITLDRLRYGARLAKETGLPVLVSGGAREGMTPVAILMADSLKKYFGITPRWLEDRSLDTADNALFSADILKNAGVRRVALVTSALHMRRAVFAFKHAGLQIVPAPTDFTSDVFTKQRMYEYFPNTEAAFYGWAVVHEWVGILVQRIKAGIGGDKIHQE